MSGAQGGFVVGKFYKVPCVHGRWHQTTAWWPVMGPKHEDARILNFPYAHYHIDWRFVSPKIAAGYRDNYLFGNEYTRPLMESGQINVSGLSEPAIRIRKCQSEHRLPHYPGNATWRQLEVAHEKCKLNGLICPHQGTDLSNEPVDEHGNVICPLHGLKWNVITLELVRQ